MNVSKALCLFVCSLGLSSCDEGPVAHVPSANSGGPTGDVLASPTDGAQAIDAAVATFSLSVEHPMEAMSTRGETVAIEGRIEGGLPPFSLSVEATFMEPSLRSIEVDDGAFAVALPAPNDGAYVVAVTAVDGRGLVSRIERHATHLRRGPDRTPPLITIERPQPGQRVGRTSVLTGTVVDPLVDGELKSGLARLRLDDRPVAVDETGVFTASFEAAVSGPRAIRIVATDVAGNLGEWVSDFEADVDPPLIEVQEPTPDEVIVADEIDVAFTTRDASALAMVSVNRASAAPPDLDGVYRETLRDLPEGRNEVRIEAVDATLNAAVVTRSFERRAPGPDPTPPTLSVSQPRLHDWLDGPIVEFLGTAIDPPSPEGTRHSGLAAVLVDAEVAVLNADGSFSLESRRADGVHVAELVAVDASGLISDPVFVRFRVGPSIADVTGPSLTVESPLEAETVYADDVVFTGSALDAESGVRSLRAGASEFAVGEGAFSVSVADLPGGGLPVVVQAVDWAGNVTELVLSFIRRPGTHGGRIHFTDVSAASFGGAANVPRASSDTAGIGVGAALVDVDGDGDLDLVTTGVDRDGFDAATPPGLFLNLSPNVEQGRFQRDAEAFDPPLDGLPAYAVAAGDPDGDGDSDLYFCVDGQDRLYRNDGGRFTDVTANSGLFDLGGRHSQAAFADFDGDGQDDLYVSGFPTELAAQHSYPAGEPLPPRAMFFMNRGGLRFEDVTDRTGLNLEIASTHASLIFDLDHDGDLDIYDANDIFTQGRSDEVWLQTGTAPDGTPSFEPASRAWGLDDSTYRMGAALGDIDNDLRPDLFLTDVNPKRLYALWGALPLVDRAMDLGIANDRIPDPGRPGRSEALWGWGVDLTDLDRDGFLDVLIVNGSVASSFSRTIFFQVPYVFRNNRALGFDDVTTDAGLEAIEPFNPNIANDMWGRGAYPGDLDGDGDRDYVISSMLGPFRVLDNDSDRVGRALRVRLRGTHSGAAAIGAKITVTADGWTHAGFRSAGGNTRGHGEDVLEIPLGRVRQIDEVRVEWPSGLSDVLVRPVVSELDELSIVEPRLFELETRRVPPLGLIVLRFTAEAPEGLSLTQDGADVPLLRRDGRVEAEVRHDGHSGWRVLRFRLDGEPLAIRVSVYFE